MSKNYHYFPIKEGEYQHINTIPTKLTKNGLKEKALFGIYRCRITKKPGDNRSTKLFHFNKDNYYTNLDIDIARQYNLDIALVTDVQSNFLYYSEDKLTNGALLFGHYVKELYALKQLKVKCAKDLLNILWGALCEKKIKKRKVSYDEEVHIDNANIESVYSSEDALHFRFISYDHGHYMTPFARVGAFVIAYGRDRLYHSFNKYEDEIIRVHTDGFYLTRQPDDILLGLGLGHLKYEGTKDVDLRGLNKIGLKK